MAQDISSIDNDRVYLALDDRDFVRCGGHYLIYGSEYILSIAAGLEKVFNRNYRHYLKQFGIPTIFELSIPIEWLSLAERRALACYLGRAVADDSCGELIDFTVTLKHEVPAEYVVGMSHPPVIPPYSPFLAHMS